MNIGLIIAKNFRQTHWIGVCSVMQNNSQDDRFLKSTVAQFEQFVHVEFMCVCVRVVFAHPFLTRQFCLGNNCNAIIIATVFLTHFDNLTDPDGRAFVQMFRYESNTISLFIIMQISFTISNLFHFLMQWLFSIGLSSLILVFHFSRVEMIISCFFVCVFFRSICLEFLLLQTLLHSIVRAF